MCVCMYIYIYVFPYREVLDASVNSEKARSVNVRCPSHLANVVPLDAAWNHRKVLVAKSLLQISGSK